MKEIQEASTMPPQPPEGWVDDELDLGRIVRVLHQWRREIVVVTAGVFLAAVAGVLALDYKRGPVYEATALVAIVRTKTEVAFEERFRTLSEVEAMQRQADFGARRGALVGLVRHGDVARAVIERMGDRLEEGEQVPARLLNRVSAELAQAPGGRAATGGDLIAVTVRADDPVKAADLVNIWAEEYVDRVNELYGTMPEEVLGSVRAELVGAQRHYETAQQALEGFIAANRIPHLDRVIAEKKEIIDSLQQGRKTAVASLVEAEVEARRQVISAYIGSLAQNRLLAFNKEQEAKRKFVAALIDSEVEARLQALKSDREARSRMFAQYVDSQIQNQLLALQKEQEKKRQLFQGFSDADVKSKLAVFNQQVEDRIGSLTREYEVRRRLERLLENTRGLLAQVREAGDAGAASTGLTLLLLKAEAHAATGVLPANLQLQLGSVPDLNLGAEAQIRDLDALEAALRDRIGRLESSIADRSVGLFRNEGYRLLDAERPPDDELFAAVRRTYLELFQVDELARTADEATAASALSEAIRRRYDEMFQLGSLALASAEEPVDTTSFAAIRQRYPELFRVGALATLTDSVGRDTPLDRLADERAQDLLQLRGLEDVPRYSAGAEPLLRAIDGLEREIQAVEAEKEAEAARRRSLTQERDLAWTTLTTLRNKSAELALAASAFNAEVRFASPAVEPDRPEGTRVTLAAAVAGFLGLMLSLFLVFVAEALGRKPFLTPPAPA